MVLRPSYHSTSSHSFLPPCCFRTCVAITGFRSQTSSPLGNLYQHLPSREGVLRQLMHLNGYLEAGILLNRSKVQISGGLLGKGEKLKFRIGQHIYKSEVK